MRIIAGQWGGRRLAQVGRGDPGAALRPTPDRVREALFSILTGGRFGDAVEGAVVLDLFAGTGALGLEALSRGASHATFVDCGRAAQSLLRRNIADLGANVTILTGDAARLPANTGAPATLVFLDPPYGKGLGRSALESARAGGWIAPGATVVWEESRPMDPPPGFALADQRRYGDTAITILTAE